MYIIDAVADPAGAIPRVARLMYNIETGTRAYEWGPGSSADPLADPRPGFLTITVPGQTTRAPAVAVSYRPAVGYVYYVPSAALQLEDFARKLGRELEGMTAHLMGYLPVEAAPQATLFSQGRVVNETRVTPLRVAHAKPWGPLDVRSARSIHVLKVGDDRRPPSHFSHRAGFTWYVAPISLATQIRTFTSMNELNAVVAGIFFDTFHGGNERPEPMLKITGAIFALPKLSAETRKAFRDWSAPDVADAILIVDGPRFDLVGSAAATHLKHWANPENAAAAPAGLSVPALQKSAVASVCGFCEIPLWGTVYAATHAHVAPHYMALCRWCAGCLTRDQHRYRLESGRTRRDAYAGTPFAAALPLLEARDVARVAADHKKPPYFLVTLASGEKVVLESTETYAKDAPPCLRDEALRELKLPSVSWASIAEARG